MPTQRRAEAASWDDLVAQVAEATCGARTSGSGVGLELELLPVTRASPTQRLRLDRPVGEVPATRALIEAAREDAAAAGATLSVEPGGQVEIATGCCQQVPDAIDQLERVAGRLASRFHDARAQLVAAGMDVWHDLAEVPQQLDHPRYRAMDAYLAARSGDGPLMMRHTCALQINLDLGTDERREDRWQVANLLAPVATATFASSPGTLRGRPVRSRRAAAWSHLDPTRTGFPAGIIRGEGRLEDHVVELAWDADVLLVRTPDGDAHPGRPGWRFGDWVTHGHPRHGWPTRQDVAEHLTTLFPEVRARGFIELRGIDAVPARFRSAVVLLIAGAVVDDAARSAIRGLLEPHRARLPRLNTQAWSAGLTDPATCALAVEVWSYARAGAARLPGVAGHHLAAIDAYIDRFTVRGRCPADELAELLAGDRAAALRWATEPLPTVSEVR